MIRVYHTWDEWECYPAGFYEKQPARKGMSDSECADECASLLTDPVRYREALQRVFNEWPNSCEHYLTNERMNRLNWLASAATCIIVGAPKRFKAGYPDLTQAEKDTVNQITLDALNDWMTDFGAAPLDLEGAGISQKVDLY